jgi:putative superfamily III holin-X
VSMGNGNGAAARPGAGRRPIGMVVSAIVGGFRTLARQHVELAKLEVAEAASIRGQGAGMFAGAGVVGLYAIGFLAAAGAAGLAVVVPVWAAILIVGVLLVVIAGMLVLIGRRAMRTAPPPAVKTRETLKEDAAWAKRQIAS